LWKLLIFILIFIIFLENWNQTHNLTQLRLNTNILHSTDSGFLEMQTFQRSKFLSVFTDIEELKNNALNKNSYIFLKTTNNYLTVTWRDVSHKNYSSWHTYMDGFLSSRSMSFSRLVSCFSNMVFRFTFGTVSVSIGSSKNSLWSSAQLVLSPWKPHARSTL